MSSPTLHKYEMSIASRLLSWNRDCGKNRRNLRIWSKRNETTESMRTFFYSLDLWLRLAFFRAPFHRAQVSSNEHSEIWHHLLATNVLDLFLFMFIPLWSWKLFKDLIRSIFAVSAILSRINPFLSHGFRGEMSRWTIRARRKGKATVRCQEFKASYSSCMRRWAV